MTLQTPHTPARKKLPLKERYSLLTRDLDWEPSYVSKYELYPYTKYEGIVVHDWDGWDRPSVITDGEGGTRSFQYDANSNLTRVTRSGA